jgi:hypothetical protein
MPGAALAVGGSIMANTSAAPLRGKGAYRYNLLFWMHTAIKGWGKPLPYGVLRSLPGFTKSDFKKLKDGKQIRREPEKTGKEYVIGDYLQEEFKEGMIPLDIPDNRFKGFEVPKRYGIEGDPVPLNDSRLCSLESYWGSGFEQERRLPFPPRTRIAGFPLILIYRIPGKVWVITSKESSISPVTMSDIYGWCAKNCV